MVHKMTNCAQLKFDLWDQKNSHSKLEVPIIIIIIIIIIITTKIIIRRKVSNYTRWKAWFSNSINEIFTIVPKHLILVNH